MVPDVEAVGSQSPLEWVVGVADHSVDEASNEVLGHKDPSVDVYSMGKGRRTGLHRCLELVVASWRARRRDVAG